MLLQVISAFFGTVAFAVIFNVPKEEFLSSGICGSTGWLCYLLCFSVFGSKVLASFIASSIIGVISEILARLRKKPVTLFMVPSIIVFVPGAGCYYTMLSIIRRNYGSAAKLGFETISIALAIAAGLLMATSGVRILKYRKIKT